MMPNLARKLDPLLRPFQAVIGKTTHAHCHTVDDECRHYRIMPECSCHRTMLFERKCRGQHIQRLWCFCQVTSKERLCTVGIGGDGEQCRVLLRPGNRYE